MQPQRKLPTVLEQVCEHTGSCSYMHSSISRQLEVIANLRHLHTDKALIKIGQVSCAYLHLYPSSASKNPKGQAQAGRPSYVVMHCLSHLSSGVHFLFVGHFSSSSPRGQSFIPSHTCFLFTQLRNALLRRCSCVLHMYWSSSQNTWQFISSSPLVQSRTPSHNQVFCRNKHNFSIPHTMI